MDKDRLYGYLSFLIPFLIYVVTLNGVFQSDYPQSILGTQYALWSRHSFSLGAPDSLLVQTTDKGLFNGQYYSAISPGFAIVSFPFAAMGFILDGSKLNIFGNALLLDELFLGMTAALAVLFTYKICRFYAQPIPSFISALVLAFGTSVWPFATMIFIHDASLLFSVASVYLVLRYAKGNSSWTSLPIAGLSLGVASFVEYIAGLAAIPILAYLILTKSRTRSIASFVGGFLVGPLLSLSFNYLVFGNPLLFPEQLKGDSSVGLLARFDLLGSALHAALYLVSPYRGLLYFSPVLFLGLYGLYRMAKSRQTRLDAALFVAIFLTVLVAYSSWQDWSGGLAYGPRFLILGLPYLAVPLCIVLSEPRSIPLRAGFLSLLILSSFIEGVGALTTALSVSGNTSLYQPLVLNIPWLLQGRLDSWWIGRIGGSVPLVDQVFSAALFVILWCAFVLLLRKLWSASDGLPRPAPGGTGQVKTGTRQSS